MLDKQNQASGNNKIWFFIVARELADMVTTGVGLGNITAFVHEDSATDGIPPS